MAIFKDDEEYEFIKDLKHAYKDSLAKSTAQKIFETIPDHVFWDIKQPLAKPEHKDVNPYNPFRRYPFQSFFELRDYEEYNERRTHKQNLRDAVSVYRKY